MFKNNVEIMCASKLSKSLLNPEKGSRFNNSKTSDQIRSQTSHHFHWVPGSIHSHTTRPQDAPPTRPSFPRRQSRCPRGKDVWWSGWRAGHRPRPGRDVSREGQVHDPWQNRNLFFVFFEKALHLHWKTVLKSRNDLFWPCFGTNGV